MEVYIVNSANREIHTDLLTEFFKARHEVYASELEWVPSSPDGLEKDDFDTDAAVYLIGVSNQGDFIAGSRIVPTHLPHLLSENFADLCTRGPLIRSPDVAEWTRGFIVKKHREGGGLALKAKCCAAVMEYCLINGYRQIGGIQDAKWLAIWARMGWKVHIHGDAIDIGGENWLPAYFDVSAEALAGARKWGKLDGSILVHQKPSRRLEVA